jgi:hypothetical protein
MNGYELSRNWFDFCFENPELINPAHTAIYIFAIEHCNRLGWKKKFGFPSQMTMDALGIKKHQTYIKYFNDLVKWRFFELIQKSKNQYSANIISINAMPKKGKALDKAFIIHAAKQRQSNGQSIDSIIKQLNKEQLTINQLTKLKRIVLENEKKEITFPFESEKFKKAWDIWKNYKIKEHNFMYKSEISEQAALNKLTKLAGGAENMCYEIILQSLENGWKGFFRIEIPKKNKDAAMHDYKQQIVDEINEASKTE